MERKRKNIPRSHTFCVNCDLTQGPIAFTIEGIKLKKINVPADDISVSVEGSAIRIHVKGSPHFL
jgi:hypothetical protein